MRKVLLWLLLLLALPVSGAELTFDFGEFATNGPPPGFRNALFGRGRMADWQVIMDEIPPAIEPATSKAPVVNRRAAVTQVQRDPTDERYPLLIYDNETFGDFTLTTRFKVTGGLMEQMAGIAFRIQNETNFYVVRANAMDGDLRFYKVVNGFRGPLVGSKLPVALGEWHELKIECQGNQISAWLDGHEALKQVSDSSFSSGKIGYWTKSDARCNFVDTRITYKPRETLAQIIVRDLVTRYQRLHDLKLYLPDEKGELRVAAAKNASDLGTPGDKPQQDSFTRNAMFVAKGKSDVSVVLPLHDRNGDPMGVVTVTMESFKGQTEENAITRALPINKEISLRGKSIEELKQ